MRACYSTYVYEDVIDVAETNCCVVSVYIEFVIQLNSPSAKFSASHNVALMKLYIVFSDVINTSSLMK